MSSEVKASSNNTFGDIVHRTRAGLVLLLVAALPPQILGHLVLGQSASTMLLFGVMVALMNTLFGGVRVGVIASMGFLVLAPISLVVGTNPLAGACLMAVVCISVGRSSLWRRYGALYMVPLGMIYLMTLPMSVTSTMVGGITETSHLLAVLAVTGCCSAWAITGVWLLHYAKGIPSSVQNTQLDAMRYTVVMTVLVFVSTFYVLSQGRDSHGAWLVLTIFMVLQVPAMTTRHRAVHRVAGTVAGALFAAVISSLVTERWVIISLLILALLGVLATAGHEPYALFSFFMTTMILLGISPTGATIEASVGRVAYTLAGALLALFALALVRFIPPLRSA